MGKWRGEMWRMIVWKTYTIACGRLGRTNGLFCDGETARTVDEGEIEGEMEPDWDNRGRDGDALLLEDLLLE